MSDCLFCKMVAGQIPSTKVFEDERLLAFEDINPQAPIHILIVPKKHLVDLFDGSQDSALMGEIIARSAAIAKDRGVTDFRLVSTTGREGGQQVFHLHVHRPPGRRMLWASR